MKNICICKNKNNLIEIRLEIKYETINEKIFKNIEKFLLK